jgi:hypothetical protein
MPNAPNRPLDPADVAVALAIALDAQGRDYAVGGAIALGYWTEPRGTMDVDLTLFMTQDDPRAVVEQLRSIGCVVDEKEAAQLLLEHGFCRASYHNVRVDVFVETYEFYKTVKRRRTRVILRDREVMILDAETLCVFKMMFFREKDFLDIKGIMRDLGSALDRKFIREQLVEICGSRDPRIIRWDEITAEIPA